MPKDVSFKKAIEMAKKKYGEEFIKHNIFIVLNEIKKKEG